MSRTDLPAGPEHAVRLGQTARNMPEVAHAKGTHDNVKRPFLKGQMLISPHECCRGAALFHFLTPNRSISSATSTPIMRLGSNGPVAKVKSAVPVADPECAVCWTTANCLMRGDASRCQCLRSADDSACHSCAIASNISRLRLLCSAIFSSFLACQKLPPH